MTDARIKQKRKNFEATLTEAYRHDRYILLLRELMNMISAYSEKKFEPHGDFSAGIDYYYDIGLCQDEDRRNIVLLSVCLSNDKNIENTRDLQRSYAKRLLTTGGAGALIAFHTKNKPEKWRLSLVRKDDEFARGKTRKTLTSEKFYSYLVGKGEPCHTALEQLFPLFLLEGDRNPSLDDLEKAFSIEAITRNFFDRYRDKYLDLKEFLEHNPQFVAEAMSSGFDAEQFAKKLMGQIVFLYFLQKKGWLGVEAFPKKLNESEYKSGFFSRGRKPKTLMRRVYKRDWQGGYVLDVNALLSLSPEDENTLSTLVRGSAWGDGPKDFMRQIFTSCKKAGKNFFDDYLEPLFYTGLNQNRGKNFFLPLHRRIPFLNGGLFEELDGYDWRNNAFRIPNELFSNADTKGRDADGILDVFDRFNFTIAENEPMAWDVAIDPEILGKVFEKLLDVKDRKSKGAFYTPREIVHYMCQESLIRYLSGKTGIPDADMRKFILYGEYFRDEDTKKTLPVDDATGRVLVGDEIYRHKHHMEFDKRKTLEIPESIFSYQKRINRLDEIDNLLAKVRVLDPAVGSGAFPLGMLTEIVKARETLTSYKLIEMDRRQRFYCRSARSPYLLKRESIKNCIFACDAEASAVDITKLRLWLSLVIDDQIMDDENEELGYSTKPRELPNLDANILCGNSLVDEFRGIALLKKDPGEDREAGQGLLTDYDPNRELRIKQIIELQSGLFDEKDPIAKDEIKEQIQGIYDKVVLERLGDDPDLVDAYYQAITQPSRPFVLWRLSFPQVFRDNGGFDIVVGNPPYIQLQKALDDKRKFGDLYEGMGFETFAKTGDISCLFYEKGYSLLREKGVLAFITSNKWMRAGYGEKLRTFLLKKTNPLCLIDFAGQKVFESATVDVNILIFSKEKKTGATAACVVKEKCKNNLGDYVEQNSVSAQYEVGESWYVLTPIEQAIKEKNIEQAIKAKIEAVGKPLKDWGVSINYGIRTGWDKAFIIDGAKKDELIAKDPKSAEIIRPLLRGRDIKRYSYTFADQWLIATFPSRNYDIEDYPAIKEHFLSFGKDRLEQSGKFVLVDGKKIKARKKTKNKWFETQDTISYWNDFSQQKIVWGVLCLSSQFAFVEEDFFINAPSPMIVPGNKYLLAVLNSRLGDWYIRQLGVTRNGGYFEYKPMFVENLPVPILIEEKQVEFIQLVDQIISAKENSQETLMLEEKIDNAVYRLYGLNEEEVQFINND